MIRPPASYVPGRAAAMPAAPPQDDAAAAREGSPVPEDLLSLFGESRGSRGSSAPEPETGYGDFDEESAESVAVPAPDTEYLDHLKTVAAPEDGAPDPMSLFG